MKLALGTVQFGLNYGVTNRDGQVAINEVKKILNYASEIGVDTLDTASEYGNSEIVLGQAGVNNYQIITKTISLKNGQDAVIKAFYESLDNLNVQKIYGLLIHSIDDIKENQFKSLFGKLNEFKKVGLINKIGFSTYTSEQVDFLLENFDFDLIQVPFNVFDTRLVEGGQLYALKEKNIEIHARSVFLQGVLLDMENLSDYFLRWKNQFSEYHNLVEKSGLSLLEYAINFVLNTHKIDKVLVGVSSEKQLREIVNAVKKPISLDAHFINDVDLLNPSLWKT